MNTEEKNNKGIIEQLINSSTVANLDYEVVPYGCNVEIRCSDIDNLSYVETILMSVDEIPIRGTVRLTYNKIIKL